MKKFFLVVSLLFALSAANVAAQSWKNLLGKVAEEVVDGVASSDEGSALGNVLGTLLGNAVAFDDASLKGSWEFNGSACVLESENVLSSVGGNVITSKVEAKIDENLAKFGIVPGKCSFLFNADKSCQLTFGGRNIYGTYTVEPETKMLTLAFLYGKFTIKSYLVYNVTDLNVVFEADKLLALVKNVASSNSAQSGADTSALSSTLGVMGTLLNSYDGMMLGIKLKRVGEAPVANVPASGSETNSNATQQSDNSAVGNALKGLFKLK